MTKQICPTRVNVRAYGIDVDASAAEVAGENPGELADRLTETHESTGELPDKTSRCP